MIIVEGVLRQKILASGVLLREVEDPEECSWVLDCSEVDVVAARALAREFGCAGPQSVIQLVVGDRAKKHRVRSGSPICSTVWTTASPSGCLWQLVLDPESDFFEQVYVPAPQLHVVLQARWRSVPEMALLLTAHAGTFRPESGGVSYDVDPFLSFKDLREFLHGLPPKVAGKGKVREAMAYAFEHCGSLPECQWAVMLALAETWSGYGVDRPETNHELKVPAGLLSLADGRQTLRPDLYWPREALALEHDGLDEHSEPEDVLRDKDRQTVLALMGIQTVPLTKDVLGDFNAFDAVGVWAHERINGAPLSDDTDLVAGRKALYESLVVAPFLW